MLDVKVRLFLGTSRHTQASVGRANLVCTETGELPAVLRKAAEAWYREAQYKAHRTSFLLCCCGPPAYPS
jgi:hypothetical protein